MNDRIEKIQKICHKLDEIVVVMDKIGSGFDDKERLALTLLLFFKQKNILNSLAEIRTFIHEELEGFMEVELYDDFIEAEREMWKPSYDASKEELLKMLK